MNVGILGNQLWVDVNKLLKFQKKEFFFKKKCIILQTAIQFVFILPMYWFFLGKKRFGYNDHASMQSQRQDWLVTVGV